ncbi:SirB2 family protein [Pseudoxanthomonas mexicana]|jgi:uncharacterized membrane protein SirB2
MAHYYLQIKSAHVFLGLLVAALFFLSFATVSINSLKTIRTPVKYLSWTLDVSLLTAAMMLLTILPGAMYANGWLLVKLVALGGFVACRHAMTTERSPFMPRWGWLLVGCVLLAYAYSVARAHHPLGLLANFIA